jgi:hypothetical protein
MSKQDKQGYKYLAIFKVIENDVVVQEDDRTFRHPKDDTSQMTPEQAFRLADTWADGRWTDIEVYETVSTTRKIERPPPIGKGGNHA